MAQGNWGILEKKPAPTLAEFLRKDFEPFTKSRFATIPKSLDYYLSGANMLRESDLSTQPIDQITDQHAGQFAARYSNLSPSTVNCGLRTLRRALRLAFDWGKLERPPKISLAKGERQRDRVLTDDEAQDYLTACGKPWRDAATLILGSGLRPGEVYKLRWEHVLFRLGDPPALPGWQKKFDIFGSALYPRRRGRDRPIRTSQSVGFDFDRLRSGPFEGPATVKPPALPEDHY